MVMSKFNCIGANWREVKGFGLHLLDSRWFMFFATLLIMSVNGSSYMFGLYSNDIKSSLGYDQTTLNLISFFKDLGGNLGVLARLTYEVAPPWIFLLSGSIMNFFGFFMIWLSVSHRLGAKPHVWQMCLYMLIGANSESFPNTGALVTCVKNFPKSRGIVIGLLKGLIGLSGAIMTQIYHAVNGDNTKALILLLACLPTIVPIVFIPTIRIIKIARPGNELKVFYSFLYILLVLAGFIMVTIIIQNKLRLKNVSKKPERGDDYALLQAIFSIDMLILFTATTCSIGGTLAAIDNMVSSLIGSYIFNVRVAGRFYDREALKQGKDNLNCIGARCYRVAFVTISAATFFACIVSIILVLRTKNFYQGDIYNKFKDEAKHIKNNDVSLTRDCVVPMKDMEAKANIGRAAVIDVAAENEHTSNATIDRR
ncbi:Nodulin-like domain-containing protein [Citrus sinensis]|nr:Nodulin-like domain-containing protein [Citrus sinensis]